MLHHGFPLSPDPAAPGAIDLASVLQAGWSATGDLDLLKALPVAVYLTDATGRLTFWNQAASTIWASEPLVGDRASDRWHIVDEAGRALPARSSPLDAVLRSGRAMAERTTLTAVRHDGSVVHVSSQPTPLFDGEGRLTGVVDVLLDVTGQRETEARLRESEDDYRHAVALNPQMPWTADASGAMLQVNERWCQLTGQSHDAAARDGWTAAAHPADVPHVVRSFNACALDGTPLDVQFRIRLRDETDRWMRARASPRRDADGAIIRWYGSTEDIHDAVIAQQALAAAEERYRYAGQATRDVFWDHDFRTDTIRWSEGLEETFGHELHAEAVAGVFWLDKIHPCDRERVETSVADAIAAGDARWTSEYRFRRADGSYAHVLDRGSFLRDEAGTTVRAIGAMLDFTDRKQTEADLRLSEERLRLALAAARLGIADFDAIDGHEHWSDELRSILGLVPDAPSGVKTYLSLVHPDDLPAALEQNRRTRAGDFGHGFRATRRIIRPIDGEHRWISTEGHVLRDDAGKVFRVIITIRDITGEKLAQDRVSWAATHDAMTQLPNKAAFQEALLEALSPVDARDTSLLLVDLDHFKHVNDTLGHQAGDALLVEVGSRLRRALPADAFVARFGGDEFAIILAGQSNDGAVRIADDLLKVLERPCAIDAARSIDVRASIGIATYPADGRDASTLLQAADMALYAAKATGRYAVRTYCAEMRAGLQRQVSAIRQARQALADRALVPFYQPKVTLAGSVTVGAEALLRWRHPQRGIQGACTLFAALDDPELGGKIGEAMIAAVLDDLRRWLHAGEPVGRVAINVSPVQAGDAGFADRLLESLAAHAVPPASLEVEVTETALMGARVDQIVEELTALRAAGVTVALDDFGTGYSSLSHLARFPVDVVKIDRSFVAGLCRTRADRAVVEAVLGLSSALGLTTVAEGVETVEQVQLLRGLGCAMAQGFLYSPAVPAASFDWQATYGAADL